MKYLKKCLPLSYWWRKNDGTGFQRSKSLQVWTDFSGWQPGSSRLESKKYPSGHLNHVGYSNDGQWSQPTIPHDLHFWKWRQFLEIGFRHFSVIFSCSLLLFCYEAQKTFKLWYAHYGMQYYLICKLWYDMQTIVGIQYAAYYGMQWNSLRNRIVT